MGNKQRKHVLLHFQRKVFNMKNILLFLLTTILFQLTAFPVFAVTTTPTPTSAPKTTEEPKNLNILNDLKDKIASRVAQLNLVQRKGIIGTVENVSGTQITLLDRTGEKRLVDVDELTKFSSPSAKTAFGISDLTKGTNVDILGLYNKQTKHTLARFVDVVTVPHFLQGEIATIDTENFSLTVISDDGKLRYVDIENLTKTSVYTKEDGLEKAGFSKIELGKQVIIVGYSDKNNPKRILASRVLVFPQAPHNPRIIIPQQTLNPDEEVTPSTGSGKKLTPITR